MSSIALPFLLQSVRREFSVRYKNTFGGIIWILIQPIVTLGIYWYVFTFIFKARATSAGAEEIAFVAFLAVALWPWVFFSETISRSTTVITDNSDLIGRVAIPKMLLVISPLIASFMINFIGYILVLGCLVATGYLEPSFGMLLIPGVFALMALFALGICWLVASLNVFVRDAGQFVPQLLMVWFFLTPILYPKTLIPESLTSVAALNPLAIYIGLFREVVFRTGEYTMTHAFFAALISAASLLLGFLVFKRLETHFEDFM